MLLQLFFPVLHIIIEVCTWNFLLYSLCPNVDQDLWYAVSLSEASWHIIDFGPYWFKKWLLN